MKKLLATLFILGSVSAHALDLTGYIKLQESLAADDFKTSVENHKQLCGKELKSFKNAYSDCQKSFKSIDELRTSFKSLSEVYLKNADKNDLKNLTTATCPMAGAKWIQKNGSLRNPYYGKSMLECGEKI